MHVLDILYTIPHIGGLAETNQQEWFFLVGWLLHGRLQGLSSPIVFSVGG